MYCVMVPTPRWWRRRRCVRRFEPCCNWQWVPMNTETKRIALVLGAGGARGLAHIGVIEVLREHGHQIVAVAGSSMGALVGGIHAAGRLDEYKRWASALERSEDRKSTRLNSSH